MLKLKLSMEKLQSFRIAIGIHFSTCAVEKPKIYPIYGGAKDCYGIREDINVLCKQGRLKEALDILHFMDKRGLRADLNIYTSLLRGCIDMKSRKEGKYVHDHMVRNGFDRDTFLGNTLVIMYAKCRSLEDARQVFDKIPERNAVSWTVIISGHVQNGRCVEGLRLFWQMKMDGIKVDQFTLANALRACVSLEVIEEGRRVHLEVIRNGFESDVFVQNVLVDMYVKCRSIEDAHKVFDKMPERNVVSWTAVIGGYAQSGQCVEAIRIFSEMHHWGVKPDQSAYASVLRVCSSIAAREQGKQVHALAVRSGFDLDIIVGSALVDIYVKCGCIEDARQVFDQMPQRNVVSWNAMIGGYAQNRRFDEALKLFQQMPERDVVSWNALVAGYAQDGNIEESLKLFNETPERDIVSWTTVITACAQNGYGQKALVLFCQMQRMGIQPNQFTFTGVLQACSNLGALNHGKEIHAEVVRRGLQDDVFVGSALVYMYGKSGSLENAQRVFDKMPELNVVSWNAIIVGYAHNGCLDEALKLFEKIPERTVVSWNAMIAGYAQNGHFNEALNFFQQMQLTGLKPNPDTFASILPAFANLAALEQGKRVHEYTIRSGFQRDVFVGSALVDMYAKCGIIEDAQKVFDNMPGRDVVFWTAMIVAYAMHGCGKEALQIFDQMENIGVKPSRVTFIGVLSACCHAGLVDRGWQYFERMIQYYHITPVMEHYCCMVDLLGRAGFLNEAHDFINKMPIKPEPAVWGSLLGACRIHGNIGLGELVAERLFELDPQKPATYVLLSNLYAAAGRWNDIEKVRKLMKDRGVKKMPGCSWIEVNKKMYSFLIGDRSHPQTEEIYAELERLSGQMKEVGYEPHRMFALNDVEEEQKEHILGHHSEKLAIAFGLINTSPGMPIRVIKNLRVCGDCHSAIKLISKIVGRDIVVRDANRFHHFKDGTCSCGDYW